MIAGHSWFLKWKKKSLFLGFWRRNGAPTRGDSSLGKRPPYHRQRFDQMLHSNSRTSKDGFIDFNCVISTASEKKSLPFPNGKKLKDNTKKWGAFKIGFQIEKIETILTIQVIQIFENSPSVIFGTSVFGLSTVLLKEAKKEVPWVEVFVLTHLVGNETAFVFFYRNKKWRIWFFFESSEFFCYLHKTSSSYNSLSYVFFLPKMLRNIKLVKDASQFQLQIQKSGNEWQA